MVNYKSLPFWNLYSSVKESAFRNYFTMGEIKIKLSLFGSKWLLFPQLLKKQDHWGTIRKHGKKKITHNFTQLKCVLKCEWLSIPAFLCSEILHLNCRSLYLFANSSRDPFFPSTLAIPPSQRSAGGRSPCCSQAHTWASPERSKDASDCWDNESLAFKLRQFLYRVSSCAKLLPLALSFNQTLGSGIFPLLPK